MSELQDLLDEIRGEDEVVIKDDPVSVANEDHEDDVELREGEEKLHKPFSLEQLEEVSIYNVRQSVYRSVAGESKVCRSVVLEAMAALPPPNQTVTAAKLTSIPSVVNKAVLDSMQTGDERDLSQKADEYAQSVRVGLAGIVSKNEGVVESYLAAIDTLDTLAKGPSVIFMETKDAVNLFTDAFETFTTLHFDPERIMFDHVKVKAVADASRALIYDHQFTELVRGNFADLVAFFKVKVVHLKELLERVKDSTLALADPKNSLSVKLAEVERGATLIQQYRESCEAFELGRFIDLATEYAAAVDACR